MFWIPLDKYVVVRNYLFVHKIRERIKLSVSWLLKITISPLQSASSVIECDRWWPSGNDFIVYENGIRKRNLHLEQNHVSADKNMRKYSYFLSHDWTTSWNNIRIVTKKMKSSSSSCAYLSHWRRTKFYVHATVYFPFKWSMSTPRLLLTINHFCATWLSKVSFG